MANKSLLATSLTAPRQRSDDAWRIPTPRRDVSGTLGEKGRYVLNPVFISCYACRGQWNQGIEMEPAVGVEPTTC